VTSSQCSGTSGQAWRLDGNALKNGDGLCLDIAGGSTESGANLIAWSCHGGVNQQWTYSGGSLKNADGRCVDIAASNRSNGANVLTWNYHGGANQVWFFLIGRNSIEPTGGSVHDGLAAFCCKVPCCHKAQMLSFC